MDTNNLTIRQFKPSDRPAVRDIAWNTAFFGEPADNYCDAREIISDILTEYFTDYEPESTFIAELNRTVVGYLTGTVQESQFATTFRRKILPQVIAKIIFSLTLFNKKNLRFLERAFISFSRGEFKLPQSLTADYPAVLHINVMNGYRNLDLGSKLMQTYFDYLIRCGVPGVHLGTISDKAAKFFEKHGFRLLTKKEWSFYRHILHKDVTYYLYGKKLGQSN